jgi:NTP pyrophosphatase (non-canonical NTP hydrolase)
LKPEDISTVLYSAIKIWSVLGLSAIQVLTLKLEINSRKYPKKSCQEDKTIQRYTKYAAETGIKEDSDVLLFNDINTMMILPEDFCTGARALYERNKIDFDSHFASLMEQVTTFGTERNWISNYTDESIYLSLLSELGELSSVLQWVPQNTMINDITMHQKDSLARELADVVIYLVHLCRVKNVTPVVSGADVKERVSLRGIAFPSSLESIAPNEEAPRRPKRTWYDRSQTQSAKRLQHGE